MEQNNHNQTNNDPEGQVSSSKSPKHEESKFLEHSTAHNNYEPQFESYPEIKCQENVTTSVGQASIQDERNNVELSLVNEHEKHPYIPDHHSENQFFEINQTDISHAVHPTSNEIITDTEPILQQNFKDKNMEEKEVYAQEDLNFKAQRNDIQAFSDQNSNENAVATKEEESEHYIENQTKTVQTTYVPDFNDDQTVIVDETDQYSVKKKSPEHKSYQDEYNKQQVVHNESPSNEYQNIFEDSKNNDKSIMNQDPPLIDREPDAEYEAEVEPLYQHIYPEPNSETNLRADPEEREEGNQEVNEDANLINNARDQNLDNEFYQHSLQYLVQNLNNLRDTLQTILANSDLTQEIRGQNQNILGDQGMNENNAINNDDHLHDQLLNIRRILAGNLENNQQNNANEGFDWANSWNNRFGNQENPNNINEANRQNNWSQRIEAYARQIYSALPKDFNTLFWIVFALVSIFLFYGYTTIPRAHLENPIELVDWLASSKDSRLFLMTIALFYLCAAFKFNQTLYTNFISDPGENYFKSFRESFSKYSPFYDIGLYVFVDSAILEDKLEYFLAASLLVWYTASTKFVSLQHQKLNQSAASIHSNTEQNFSKMKRIQFVSAIYLIMNSQIAYTVIWFAAYASYLTIFIFAALSIIAIIEPLKVFLSSTILVKNYSLISNNNTREISDPKFKIELLIDLLHQFVVLLLIAVLGLTCGHQVAISIAMYWLSFTNSVENLKKCYNKYSNWIKLQKRLNEVFPIVERSEDAPEELCSICHENILIARRLPCGHIFHLKCLIYWLDNQKTCPNCRANMGNLNELMGNNRQESTVSRIFNQVLAPFRSLFNRA